MPNWTSNTIRAEGTEQDLRSFLESVKWQDQLFDFNRIIPMPEILKHTGCGSHTIDGEEVSSWYVVNPHVLLPGEDNVRRFTPDEEDILKEIGHNDWYSWSNANWGTKWNACSPEISDETIGEGYVEISFQTAWDVPMPVFQKMFGMFPKLSFVCTWQYECEEERHAIESAATEPGTEPITATGHTTGPWSYNRDEGGMHGHVISTGDYVICELPDAGDGAAPHTEANAFLIAAAPGLLAVAQLALEYLDGQEYLQACAIVATAKGGRV